MGTETTIADVVRAASVSRRTFYEHLPTRPMPDGAVRGGHRRGHGGAARRHRPAHSEWRVQVEQAMAAYLAALARRPVLLRTLFIDILGLGATGLAVRRQVHTSWPT